MGIELNNEQIYLVYDLETWFHSSTSKQTYEISGAAGTGKTTVIKFFIEKLGLSYDEVLFVAFMGKAATQMARNGLPAKTIHSAIYEYTEKIARDENGKMILLPNKKPKLIHAFELKDHISKKIKLIVLDEGSMVDKKIGEDLLSFNIPVVVLGDLNQLPPVFGSPFFLKEPDTILTQIMRQAENNPIIWLSQQVLNYQPLKYGVYGSSSVIPKKDITDFHFKNADMIITGTNRLRFNINNYCREYIKRIKNLDRPHLYEKVICRKNNWDQCIGKNFYLTNGTTGYIDDIYKESFNGKSIMIDFRPDFLDKAFKHLNIDYKHLYEIPGQQSGDDANYRFMYEKFEYAYAITLHSSQGSQWNNVLYLHEDFTNNKEDRKRTLYTAITRGVNSDTIVI